MDIATWCCRPSICNNNVYFNMLIFFICSVIQFYMKFGCSKESNLSTSEPVLLRYSTDGGIHWSVLGRYDAVVFTVPAYVVVSIPYGAKTHSTRIHWWQPVSDHTRSTRRVDWAIDQVNSVFSLSTYFGLHNILSEACYSC